MTREEAIKRLEIIATNLCGQSAQNPNLWPDYKAVDMAISAIRQQDHFREATKKVEPLTLDELLEMDGEPVWVQFLRNKIGYWDLIGCHNSEFIRFYRSGFLIIGEYSKNFLVYRQKPEEGTV